MTTSPVVATASAAMVVADSMAALRTAPFADHVSQLTTLLSQGNRAFLIGAGCSKCAGLPLMEELTRKVLETLPADVKAHAILTGLQQHFSGGKGCTIEDYMSELVDLITIAERRRLRSATAANVCIDGKEYCLDELAQALIQIKNAIAGVIGKAKPTICCPVHG